MTDQQPAMPQTAQDSYVNSYVPPAPQVQSEPQLEPTMPAAAPQSQPQADQTADATPQSLEDQNIFHLLGVTDGTDQEKEKFLDELQQVIWEDFIENDVQLLITAEEMTQLRQIMDKGTTPEVQEEMIVFLEKLIPDLEEVMLEKALELKEDMVRERISGMREFFVSRPQALETLNQAEQLISQDQWRRAADLLNGLSVTS